MIFNWMTITRLQLFPKIMIEIIEKEQLKFLCLMKELKENKETLRNDNDNFLVVKVKLVTKHEIRKRKVSELKIVVKIRNLA